MNCTATARRSGGVSIIDFTGRITHAAGSSAIREAIQAELEQDRTVDFIDSSGLGETVSAFVIFAEERAALASLA